MPEDGPYASAKAVDDAIKQAAKNAAVADPGVSVTDRIRQAYFDRFLCRVFSEGDASQWLLKGGTGMFARVSDGRSTKDVDLYRADLTLDAALVELRRLASIDLGDHFRFGYATHEVISGGDEQPYTDGYRVGFETYIGTFPRGRLNVDLVVSAGITGEIVVAQPANRLALPRLASIDYRLYPVVDQIADKVCATVAEYAGKPSSREKDLVDLVILALTHDVEARPLASAVQAEARQRTLEPISALTIPAGWGARYAKEIGSTPYGRDFGTRWGRRRSDARVPRSSIGPASHDGDVVAPSAHLDVAASERATHARSPRTKSASASVLLDIAPNGGRVRLRQRPSLGAAVR